MHTAHYRHTRHARCLSTLLVLWKNMSYGQGYFAIEQSAVQCTVYSLSCVMFSVQCTACSVQCAVCCVQCAVCSMQCAVCSVQCTVCSVQFSGAVCVCILQFSVCSVKCAVCSTIFQSSNGQKSPTPPPKWFPRQEFLHNPDLCLENTNILKTLFYRTGLAGAVLTTALQ